MGRQITNVQFLKRTCPTEGHGFAEYLSRNKIQRPPLPWCHTLFNNIMNSFQYILLRNTPNSISSAADKHQTKNDTIKRKVCNAQQKNDFRQTHSNTQSLSICNSNSNFIPLKSLHSTSKILNPFILSNPFKNFKVLVLLLKSAGSDNLIIALYELSSRGFSQKVTGEKV